MIPADTLIRYADLSCCGRTLQLPRKNVSPAIASIRGCSVTVRDGITKHHNRPRTRSCLDVDLRDLVPVIHRLGVCQYCSTYQVAVDEIGRSSRSRMSCLSRWRRLK